MGSSGTGSNTQLSADDRQRLENAQLRLREAVAAYEPFTGWEFKAGGHMPGHSLKDVARAQAAIAAAERELWRLREQLLGWARPSWAPGAALVSDWFSDDAAYDDISSGSER